MDIKRPRFLPGLCFAQIYFENHATFSEFVRLIDIHTKLETEIVYQIYLAINQITEKLYVGFTGMTIKERFYYHNWSAQTGSKQYFHNAIRKYGLSLFSIHIIGVAETLEEADKKEKFWIGYFRSNDRDIGYNMTSGGIGLQNPVWEVRQRLRVASSGRKVSDERRAYLSQIFSGEGNPNYGKKHTEESKRKIGEASVGRYFSPESRQKMSEAHKGDKHYLFGKKQNSDLMLKMNSARLAKGVSDGTKHKISLATRGENNPNYGKTHSPEAKAKISEAQKAAHARRKRLKEEAIKMGIDPGPYSKIEQTLGPLISLPVVDSSSPYSHL